MLWGIELPTTFGDFAVFILGLYVGVFFLAVVIQTIKGLYEDR
jgi:hypothetical protein